MLLLAMGDLIIVMNDQMETLSTTNFKKMFGYEFQGHPKCFKPDCTGDGNSILIGFNYAEIPEEMASEHVFEGQSSEYDSWVARFVYDEELRKLVRSEDPNDSILIRCEEIRSIKEYEGRNLLVSTESNSILQF